MLDTTYRVRAYLSKLSRMQKDANIRSFAWLSLESLTLKANRAMRIVLNAPCADELGRLGV